MTRFRPMPQQRLIHQHLLDNPVAAIFGDMGIGKTAATLWAISDLIIDGTIKAALIVSPLRVCTLTWPNEVEKFFDFAWLRVANLRDWEGKQAWHFGTAHIYLLNYDMLPSFASQTWGLKGRKSLPVDMVVWDELTRAKNPSSKRIKALLPWRGHFKRHVGLTGTPAPNSYLDLQPQIRLLDGGERLGTSYGQFQNRYYDSDYMGYKWTIKGEWVKEAIEQKISDITLTLRREDWIDLPPVTLVDETVHLTRDLTKDYKELEKELLLEIQDTEIAAPTAAVLVQKLLQFTSGQVYDADRRVVVLHDLKIQRLREIAAKADSPLLVATQFIHECERILAEVKGAEPFDEKRMDDWNNKKIKMWVADPRSIGHGLNLQHGSNNVVWFSLTYSRELYDQFNARVIRTGQTKPTTIWRIVCPHTVDDAVAEALRVKGDTQSGLLQALTNLQTLHKVVVCPGQKPEKKRKAA